MSYVERVGARSPVGERLAVPTLVSLGAVSLGALLAVTPQLAIAVAFVFAYAVIAMQSSALAAGVTLVLAWGVLAGNKGFASVPVGPVYIMDVLLALAVASVLLHPTTRLRMTKRGNAPLFLLGAFLALGVVNLMRGQEWGTLAFKDSVSNFYAVALVLPIALCSSTVDARRFLRTCAVPVVAGSAVFIYAQELTRRGESTGFLDYTSGTMTAASAAGLILILAQSERIDWARGAAVVILGTAVVVGLARSVWVGCALAALVMLVVGLRDRSVLLRAGALISLAAVSALTVLALLGSPLPSRLAGEAQSFVFERSPDTVDAPVENAEWRLTAWRETWRNRIQPNLLMGEGFGRPALENTSLSIKDERVQLHNGYLTVLLREGLLGLSVFVGLVLPALWRLAKVSRHGARRADRLLALGLLGALSVYLGDIAFAVIIESPMGGVPFWLLLGLAYSVAGNNRREVAAARKSLT